MDKIDRGPLLPYQVAWRSGHVETVEAHQVLLPTPPLLMTDAESPRAKRVTFHGEVDGRWVLILDADAADVLSIRLLVRDERVQ